MTDTKPTPTDSTGGDQPDWNLYSQNGGADLEQLDYQAGHQYLPMDVYVDPRTITEHFQASSIRGRWIKVRKTSS